VLQSPYAGVSGGKPLETKEKIEEAAGLDFIAILAALLASTETTGKSAQTEALNACPLRVKSGRDALRI
jgi:hypothetical protein